MLSSPQSSSGSLCKCVNPPLEVGVPRTQDFMTCRCDRSFYSLPLYVNVIFFFHQLLQGLGLIGECDAEFLPFKFVGIIQKKGVVLQAPGGYFL